MNGKKTGRTWNYLFEARRWSERRDEWKHGLQPNDPERADLELVRRARHGDAQAFHSLVDRYARPMFGLAYSLLSNASDAEDVVQETFVGAFKNLAGFEERSSVKTWLSRILVNQAARFRRDHARPKSEKIDSASEVSGRSPIAGVDARLDLLAKLDLLSAEHREVLVLREIEQMSYEEIAQVVGVPRGTVESRLHRARGELKAKLKGYLDD